MPASVGFANDSDKDSSTTQSRISGGNLTLTGEQTETEKATTIASINRDVHIDDKGDAVDSQGNDVTHSIDEIFDKEEVKKQLDAGVEITEAFSGEANKVVEDYVENQLQYLYTNLENAGTDVEKAVIESQIGDLKFEERIINILVAAVSGQVDTALLQETLSSAADEFRQITIVSSGKFAGVTDGKTVLTNLLDGKSAGLNGDGIGTGGTRIDLDQLCGPDNGRCTKSPDGSLALNAQGQVQFDIGEAEQTLAEFLASPDGLAMRGATGGVQGAIGTLFGKPYAAGSWQDKLIESFGGTHDYIGGELSGLYDEQGNATRGRSDALKAAQELWSSGPAIAISAPFAAADGLSPAVWQAISILLEGAQ